MAWLGSDWGFRKKITIQNANIDSDMTDFPVYVPLKSDADIKNEARADGYDIRFTQSNGTTLLKYERESWTIVDGGTAITADFWVKSNVTAASATEIYIYYGYPAAADGEDATNVWDANFEAVYHLNADVNDSTSNGYNLTKSGGGITHVAGIVGDCIDLDGSEYAYINAAPASSEPLTLECWAKGLIEGSGDFITVLQDKDVAAGVLLGTRSDSDVGNGEMDALSRVPGPDGEATTGNQASDNTWFYGVGVWAATNSRSAYINADIANKGTDATNSPASGLDRFILGAWFDDIGGDFNHWTGQIDEARVSSIARSEAYLKFVYYNINEGDNELTWGAEETDSINVIVTPAAISIDLTIPGVTVVEGTGVTVTPAVIPIDVTIGAVTVVGDVLISPNAIELNINLPAPTITAISAGILRLISEIDTTVTLKSIIDTEVKFISPIETGD